MIMDGVQKKKKTKMATIQSGKEKRKFRTNSQKSPYHRTCKSSHRITTNALFNSVTSLKILKFSIAAFEYFSVDVIFFLIKYFTRKN